MAHDLEKKWRTEDVKLHENVDFSAMLLSDRVLYGLKKAGFKKPSPIQLEAIPLSKIGKDVLVQAKSGTGKTLVFVVTALEMLRRKLFCPQVMILAPTREIATQICSVVKLIGSGFPKLKCFSFIGGLSVVDDIENARTCQIVVGTPGRVRQLLIEKALPTNSIRLLVLDEADQLLKMSFKSEMNDIFNMLPDDKQVIATSATYPAKLKKILFGYLREPHVACLNSREIALLGIIHYAKVIKHSPMQLIQYKIKLAALEEILKTIKFSQCLVFCNGIQRVEVLYRDIKKWGFSATYISSAKEQNDRLKAIDRLKHFKCKVLVSSDVTARGIDAENVDLVINFDLAHGTDTYMHRTGRAGRYGSVGVTISIIEENEYLIVRKIETEASFKVYKLPDPIPEDIIRNPRITEYLIEEKDPSNADSDEDVEFVEDLKSKVENGITEKTDSTHTHGNGSLDSALVKQANAEQNLDVSEAKSCSDLIKPATDLLSKIDADSVDNGNGYVEENVDAVPLSEKSASHNEKLSEFCASKMQEREIDVALSTEKRDAIGREELSNSNATEIQEGNVGANLPFMESNAIVDGKLSNSSSIEIQENDNAIGDEKVNAGEICFSLPVKESDDNANEKFSGSSATGIQDEIIAVASTEDSDAYENNKFNNSCTKEMLHVFESGDNTEGEAETLSEGNIEKMGDNIGNESSNCCVDDKEDKICGDGLHEETDEFVLQSSENLDMNSLLDSGDIFLSDKIRNSDINVVIKAFLNEYESNRSANLPSLDEENVLENEIVSGKKTVSVCKIKDLQVKKYSYMYEVCKKYDDVETSETEMPVKDENEENIKISSVKSENEILSNQDEPSLKITVHNVSDSNENESGLTERFQANCESTPLGARSKNSSAPIEMLNCKLPEIGRKIFYDNVSESNSDESSFEVTEKECSEESDTDISRFSSSSSSSEDSEEESDSDTSSISNTSSSSSSSSSVNSHQRHKLHTRKERLPFDSRSSDSRKSYCERNSTRFSCSNHSYFHYPLAQCTCQRNYPMHPGLRPKTRRQGFVPRGVHRGALNTSGRSACSSRPSTACNAACYQPSEHRCHCSSCRQKQMPVCSYWYNTFQNQWKHLQNCVDSANKYC